MRPYGLSRVACLSEYGPAVNLPSDPTLRQLNREVLKPYGWPPFGGMFDLHREWPAGIPTRPGVYAFLTGDRERIVYPVGESSVIYLGETTQRLGLRGRVRYHRGKTRHGPRRHVGHPAHEWIMARGGLCLYSADPARHPSEDRLHARAWWIEHLLLEAFQRLHRTVPVGNRCCP